jgi:hypothetical protein
MTLAIACVIKWIFTILGQSSMPMPNAQHAKHCLDVETT